MAHSYGGWPISGAVETIARRVSSIAFLDAFVPPRYPQAAFDAALARCKDDPTWRTFELAQTEAGHDAMVDAPVRIAEILQQVA